MMSDSALAILTLLINFTFITFSFANLLTINLYYFFLFLNLTFDFSELALDFQATINSNFNYVLFEVQHNYHNFVFDSHITCLLLNLQNHQKLYFYFLISESFYFNCYCCYCY